MKTLLVVMILSLGMEKVWANDFEISQVNLDEPPYWMASYDEYSDFLPGQKKFYLEKILPALKKLPGLEKTTTNKLQDAAEWYKDWDSLAKRVSYLCKNPDLASDCERVAQVRLGAFELSANQKLENRKANETSSSSKKR